MRLFLKTKVIDWSCSAMNWNSKHVMGAVTSPAWRFRLGWFIEGILTRVFIWGYTGSTEEVEDGIEFAIDGTKDKYLSAVQREIKYRLAEWVDTEEAQ